MSEGDRSTIESFIEAIHVDLVARLEQDKRLREVEQRVASQDSTLKAILAENTAGRLEQRETMRAMESRLAIAIEAMRPEKPWPAVSAVVAFVALLLVVAQVLYK